MKKGSKKVMPQIYQGIDYDFKGYDNSGKEIIVPAEGSKEYYGVRDLVDEAKKIIEDYGFTLAQLFNVSLNKPIGDVYDTSTFADNWGQSNLYRYFADGNGAINMPKTVLLELPQYMYKLGAQLWEPDKRIEFQSKVDTLEFKISDYLFDAGYIFDEKMEEYLSKLNKEQFLQFFQSINVMQLAEDTWCFWLCYSTLNSSMQNQVMEMLSKGDCSTVRNIKRLLDLYSLEKERYIELESSIHTALRKYDSDNIKLLSKFKEIAISYVKHSGDKRTILYRVLEIVKFGIWLSSTDWAVLLTYDALSYEQWPVDELKEIETFILSAMEDRRNWDKRCTIEYVIHSKKRLLQIREHREEAELEEAIAFYEEHNELPTPNG